MKTTLSVIAICAIASITFAGEKSPKNEGLRRLLKSSDVQLTTAAKDGLAVSVVSNPENISAGCSACTQTIISHSGGALFDLPTGGVSHSGGALFAAGGEEVWNQPLDRALDVQEALGNAKIVNILKEVKARIADIHSDSTTTNSTVNTGVWGWGPEGGFATTETIVFRPHRGEAK